jgi:hypothetical protein
MQHTGVSFTLTGSVPSQAALDSVSLSVSRKIVGLWKEALGNVVPAERLVAASPDVSVRKIAAYHCVVTIESQASEYALGDDQAIVTYGALLEFDREFEILDLAGLPRECWFFLANRVGDEA